MPKGSGGRRSSHRSTRRSTRRTTRRSGFRTTGRRPGVGGVGRVFINSVALGTRVTVFLLGDGTVTGRFYGVLSNGLIAIGTTFINPNDIAAFNVLGG